MYLATKQHFMLVIGAIGLRDTTEVPNNLCHRKIQFQNMALVTNEQYCEIKGNLIINFSQRKDYFAYPC